MDGVTKGFLEQGVLGLIIVALGFAVVFLYRKVNEIQEKRIAEAREAVKAVEQNTNTLDTLTDVLRAQGRAS
jgi:hypothetical protein